MFMVGSPLVGCCGSPVWVWMRYCGDPGAWFHLYPTVVAVVVPTFREVSMLVKVGAGVRVEKVRLVFVVVVPPKEDHCPAESTVAFW